MKRLLIALSIMFSAQASAEFLIEPYLGYHQGHFKPSSGTSRESTGLTYGGRFGFIYQQLQIGLDYMTGSWTDDANPKDDIKPNNFGLFLGYKFPAMIRVYGTYFFNEEYKFSANGNSTNYEGTEFRLGLGFTNLPVININVEYGFGTLERANGNSMPSMKVSYIGLVISAPFEF